MGDGSLAVVIPARLAACVACMAAGVTARFYSRKGTMEPLIWMLFALVFLAFIAAKPDKSIERLAAFARDMFKAGGVYGDRRAIQMGIVVIAGLAGTATAIWFSRHIAGHWRGYRFTLVGIAMIVSFATARSASLHELDAAGTWLEMLKAIVETTASLLAAWGAVVRIQRLRIRSPGGVETGA